MRRQLVISVWSLLFASACASTSVTQKASKYDSTKYYSLRSFTQGKATLCPRSDKSWRRQSARQLIEIANSCVLQKDWGQVDAIGEHLAGLSPDSPWGAFYMSLGSMGLQKYPRSLWMADLAIKKAPKVGFLHYQKGRVLWSMEQFEASVRSVESAVKYDPQLVDAHLFLGQVYFRDQDSKKAESHFRRVIAIEPSNTSAMVGLAEAVYQRKDIKGAISHFEKAVNASPLDLGLRLRLGEIYESEKMLSEALSTYRRARDLAKNQRRPSAEIGFDLGEKIEILEKILEQTPSGKKVSQRSDAEEARSK